jgi:hypothetical protein
MNFLLESGVKSVDEAYGFLNLSPLYSKYGTKTIELKKTPIFNHPNPTWFVPCKCFDKFAILM